ncbi:MAG: hypothetical protein HY735_18940 [Verrucomicrobia bacterium]|nr:hypothetical protein [Verrucomicrobiota bacterium]
MTEQKTASLTQSRSRSLSLDRNFGNLDESNFASGQRLDGGRPTRVDAPLARAVGELEVRLDPGKLVVFNGDKVYHAVTPLDQGEERFVITMEYVTSGEMHWFMRFVSNMKDAIAYFDLREVFLKRRRHGAAL